MTVPLVDTVVHLRSAKLAIGSEGGTVNVASQLAIVVVTQTTLLLYFTAGVGSWYGMVSVAVPLGTDVVAQTTPLASFAAESLEAFVAIVSNVGGPVIRTTERRRKCAPWWISRATTLCHSLGTS